MQQILPGIVCALFFSSLALLFQWAAREDRKYAQKMGVFLIVPLFWLLAAASLLASIVAAATSPL